MVLEVLLDDEFVEDVLFNFLCRVRAFDEVWIDNYVDVVCEFFDVLSVKCDMCLNCLM